MSLSRELLEIIERARAMAIMILVGDGHKIDGYFIKHTDFIAEKITEFLINEDEIFDKERFVIFCAFGFEVLYGAMSQKGVLPQEINTFEEFSVRYVHFLHELDSELKKPFNISEDAVKKIQESFCNFDKKWEIREKSYLTLENLNEIPFCLKEKAKTTDDCFNPEIMQSVLFSRNGQLPNYDAFTNTNYNKDFMKYPETYCDKDIKRED